LLAYAAFVLIGVGAGGNGVLLPAQMADYGVSRPTIGITFFTLSAGYVLASLFNGPVIDRFGVRTALVASGGAWAAAGAYTATRPLFAAFAGVQVVIGGAIGILESVLNAYLAPLPDGTTRLNRLHGFFGAGALLGPVLAAWIVGFASWEAFNLTLAIACAPLALGFAVAYQGKAAPSTREPTAKAPEARVLDPGAPGLGDGTAPTSPDSPSGGLLAVALRDRGVLLGAAMLAVYVGVEVGVGNWGFSYLVQARGFHSSLAGYLVSGYWLGLTAGRFLISPVVARTRLTVSGMMYCCLGGVTAAITLAWLSPAEGLTSGALVLLGFFLGPIFPTTIAMVPRLTEARLGPTAIGVLNAGALVGGSVLPWLAGSIAQGTGIWTLLPFALALSVLQLAVWLPISVRIRVGRDRADGTVKSAVL